MVGGGNSRKLGRDGGGVAANRSAPPIKHPSPATPPVRLSLGRGAPTSTSNSRPMVEESFSLVRDNPLNFAMAIKLIPDLVEEIKRAEAQGSGVRIKFSAHPNSAEGNVISVGGKNFNFSWAPEVPDLCDIYEERRSGEDGNGLLVESGTTWRKLSVQRVLDESTHNHLKMRSEEAERKLKSRKAIVLDHQNSSMKNQAKQLAAVESNSWRNYKNKKEPPSRKPKSETIQAIGSHKPLNLTTKTTSKGNKLLAGSPLTFQPDHGAPTSSPFTSVNLVKGHASVNDVATTTNKTKETHSRPPSSSGDKSKINRHTETSPSDLKDLITSLLMENHSKGMSLKALERAIGETMSCTAKQIDPILKQIAYYQAPGRYFLKQGADMGSLKKQPLESESSPQISRYKSPPSQKFEQLPAHESTLSTRTAVNDEEEAQLRSTPGHAFNDAENVDILNDSPPFMDKKVSENSERLQGSSSESGSDSASETDSGSHSKSKSRSSSESESDASSSSKQASDEDVDIMSSDAEKESKENLQNSNPVTLESPVQLRRPDSDSIDIGNYEKRDDHISDIVDIEKDSPMDNHEAANYPFPSQESRESIEEIKNHSVNYHERLETQVFDEKLYSGPDNVPNDGVKSSGHERLHKGKSKKRSDDKRSDEMPHNSKRVKGGKGNELSGTLSSIFGDIANTSSPDEPPQRPHMGSTDQTFSTYEPTTVTGYAQGIPSSSTFNSRQPAQIFSEPSGKPEARSVEKKTGKNDCSARGVKHSERKPDMHEKSKEETNNIASGKSPMLNGGNRMLQREVSELELGEFREPGNDESGAPKKQFGRKDSFKQLENKQTNSSDSSRKKPFNKIVPDSIKPTPPNPEGVREGSSKRKLQNHYDEDHVRSHSIATPTLNQQHQSSEHNKISENSSKSSRKVPINAVEQKHDHILGVVSRSTKESKKLKAGKVGDSKKRKDAPLMGVVDDSRKRRVSSPLESPYNKYEKEKPQLKGPIKNTSEYREYVKEYQEKYESYCSLNKILESYRDEFSNLGKDLESCKDRDMKKYHDILGQIKSSFRRCGEKHKRLKKIFVVLHEELKHLKQMIKDYAASYVKN